MQRWCNIKPTAAGVGFGAPGRVDIQHPPPTTTTTQPPTSLLSRGAPLSTQTVSAPALARSGGAFSAAATSVNTSSSLGALARLLRSPVPKRAAPPLKEKNRLFSSSSSSLSLSLSCCRHQSVALFITRPPPLTSTSKPPTLGFKHTQSRRCCRYDTISTVQLVACGPLTFFSLSQSVNYNNNRDRDRRCVNDRFLNVPLASSLLKRRREKHDFRFCEFV